MHDVALVIQTLMLVIFILLLVSQSPNTVLKIANCSVAIIIIEQFDFERDARMILGFEHNRSKILDIQRHILIIRATPGQAPPFQDYSAARMSRRR